MYKYTHIYTNIFTGCGYSYTDYSSTNTVTYITDLNLKITDYTYAQVG